MISSIKMKSVNKNNIKLIMRIENISALFIRFHYELLRGIYGQTHQGLWATKSSIV